MEDEDGKKKIRKGLVYHHNTQTDRQTDTHENKVWLPRQKKFAMAAALALAQIGNKQTNRYQKGEYHINQPSAIHSRSIISFHCYLCYL